MFKSRVYYPLHIRINCVSNSLNLYLEWLPNLVQDEHHWVKQVKKSIEKQSFLSSIPSAVVPTISATGQALDSDYDMLKVGRAHLELYSVYTSRVIRSKTKPLRGTHKGEPRWYSIKRRDV